MEDIKKEMGKKEFRELAKDMEGIIDHMEAVLKLHGITGTATLSVDAAGYFHFNILDSDWNFKRADKDSNSKISITICEDL